MGINKRLTLSSGEYAEPVEDDMEREEKLRKAVSRKRKGSNSRRKSVTALSKETHRKRVKRRNATHRMTSELVRRFDQIAIEDLQITNMTSRAAGTVEQPGTNVAQKTGLNRGILAQGWGETARQLKYKAEWAGRQVVEVIPRGTSKECSQCGAKPPQREYDAFRCPNHDPPLALDRDTNAARNIEYRGFGERYDPAAETPAGRGREFAPGR